MVYFTFAEALTALKMGFAMRRKDWKEGYFIKIVNKNIMVCDKELNTEESWGAEHRHLLADDWCKYFELEG